MCVCIKHQTRCRHQCVCVCLCVFSLLCSSVPAHAQQQRFSEQPEHASVILGSTVVLRCVVTFSRPLTYFSVTFSRPNLASCPTRLTIETSLPFRNVFL